MFVTILCSIKTAIFRDILIEWDIGGQLKLSCELVLKVLSHIVNYWACVSRTSVEND